MTFEVRNGCFGYKKTVPILKNISFCVESRQVLAVLGPNGVGKTTLLRSMMGMLPWTSGGSFLDGENIRDMTPGRLWREMAYVPQAKSFPFAFTVEEMILLGRSSRIGTFGTPEKAAYSVDEDGQVTLSEDNGAVLLYAGQRLWYVQDGQAAPYEKMSDQAVFVNVEEEG